MKKLMVAALILVSFGAYAEDGFKLVHVKDVATWMAPTSPTKTFVFDANNDQVRTKEGVIHGATILASSSDYNVTETLPTDKSANLVFYCANEACTASHNAAKRALDAGYKNVNVLADGIAGWVKAHKAVDKYTAKNDAKAAKKS